VAENLALQEINKRIMTGGLPAGGPRTAKAIESFVCTLPEPWCLKDPRLVITLPAWHSVLRERPSPLLLWITRDAERMRQTYEREGFAEGIFGHSLDELLALAPARYEAWPGLKLHVPFERLTEAVSLFDPTRAKGPA
jgi:hypothetical protein